ncbi:MAG: S9 family peptidase, partial [Bacteroidetes bacterium]|nr:S9 family peptidase [Bacteroidota bacterium]
MRTLCSSILLTVILFVSTQAQEQKIKYPVAKKVDHVDDYHGIKVADPYRWLEDTNSKETAEWVEAENKVTEEYLSKIPFREELRKRLTDLWNYEKYSAPSKHGSYYIYSKNDGLQEQNVIYMQNGLDAKPEVLLDPNKLSSDGSVSLGGLAISNDNKYLAYGISRGGSDWREFYVMDVQTKKLTDDVIKWAKFTGTAWYKDGFYYSRYDEPKPGEELKQANEFQKLYFHKLGTPQSDDKLILEDKENPKRGFGAGVTDDEKFLVVSVWDGSSTKNMLWYQDLSNGGSIVKFIDKPDAEYGLVDDLDGKFLVTTNWNAPNNKLVLIDPKKPGKKNWKTIIPESKYVMQSVSFVGGKLIVTYLKDANSKVSVYQPNGKYLYDVKLPALGTVNGFGGKKDENETFYTFTSFTYPPTIYKY